jgi:hypothetical protein
LSFEVSGTGVFQSQEQASNGGEAAPDNRPGGGLGTPIEAPDPLDRYRAFILAGLGLVLVAGAVYTVNRGRTKQQTAVAMLNASPPPQPAMITAPSSSNAPTALLAALKEEIFQLELEHKQGQISDQEYAKAKAALDETLARAIKRSR